MSKTLLETAVHREELYHGKILHLQRDTVELPNGQTAIREYVVHPGAVVIVPILEREDGSWELVLERQYRYPVAKVMLEFPAGKLDHGEECLASAQRELREETGYSAAEWAHAGLFHPVVAYSTEFIDVWFARGLTAGDRDLDEEEFLEVLTLPLEEFLDQCRTGSVTDGKTLIAAHWLLQIRAGAWVPDWQRV
ncbi:NUDIX domain-containing protein [Candidatus Symbiobacter mobilis]|uniref:GDP-mannose pyrophosphatase n=1 Tax=Candidatus Symbiobacter mobilis CR TaxID=946483 RepID=U5N8X2_9BURK|nr:NUDIX hydrolase [Candidatus Symbiobacter mobilis]AGX87775.1 ADP-ribose pyrophosphatase [Candidatus Symbiobacter mobilis CR]